MSYLNNVNIKAQDSASIDAFARLRVSNPDTIFDSKQIHNNQPLFWDDQEVSGAGTTSVWAQATASTVLTVALNTAGKRVRQTYRCFNYQPGKSQLVFLTGTLKNNGGGGTGIVRCMGYFNDDNGIFMQDDEGVLKAVVRSSATGSAVNDAVAQSAWNMDKMDGTGDSGITLDGTKSQIIVIDFEWLAVGRVRIGFVYNGIPVYVHEFNHANLEQGAYMSTPNLPLRYEIENDGTGAESELEHICGTVISEGGTQDIGHNRAFSNDNLPVVASSAGTVYALVGLRLKSANIDGVIKILGGSALETNTVDYEWMILFNPTLAGTAPTFADETDSVTQTAVGSAVNTVTGFTKIISGYIKGGKDTGSGSEPLNTSQILGSAIDGTRDEVWLCARPLTANADFLGALSWREIS